MVKNKTIISRGIAEFSKSELMEFINCLNENMKNYDADIQGAMERADRAEWDSLKTAKRKGVNIQYAGSRSNKH